jgi:ATP-dependent DNA helicase DinG
LPSTVLEPAHGVLMTSATLRDGNGGPMGECGGGATSLRSGRGISKPAAAPVAFDSPFDYAAQAEVLIVTDVPKGDMAGARRRLCAG